MFPIILQRDLNMRTILFLSTFLLAGQALAADTLHLPASFAYPAGQAVFADFSTADYTIRYDIPAKTALAKAVIKLTTQTRGNIVFDLVASPSEIKLDGKLTTQSEISLPGNASKARVVGAVAEVGEHTLEMTLPLTELVQWEEGGVRSAFWTTDLEDRGYLEAYLPANMEFDRVAMALHLEFVGTTKAPRFYTNGVVTQVDSTHFDVKYPAYYTASSVFFHTVPTNAMKEISFIYRSTDGREIPVVIYQRPSTWGTDQGTLERLKQNTLSILTELENDYGPFLHPSVTIYMAGSGGMEYCGATMTDSSALGHELTHSYFARGIMPANGNGGWIDEALASWRDNRYPRITNISGRANMAGRASYTRFTDYAAYTYGAKFMSYLDGRFAEQGGLKSLLRKLVTEKAFTPYTTEDFIGWAEGHYRADLKQDFQDHVYGGKAEKQIENPIHRKLSIQELRQLL